MKEVFEKLVQYLGSVGTDTNVSSWREMQHFASHPWSGDSSTMALLTRKDSKTSPYSLLRVKQTFLQTMLLFSDTVHSSLPAAKKYEDYIFFFGDSGLAMDLGVPASLALARNTTSHSGCQSVHVYVSQEDNRLSRPYRKAVKLVQKSLSDNKHRLQFIKSTCT